MVRFRSELPKTYSYTYAGSVTDANSPYADVTGNGSAWINEPALEVVDTDVPLTLSSWKAKPLNLEFSE